MIESHIQLLVRLAAQKCGFTAFRNNVATAWVGIAQRITKTQTVTVGPGDVVIRNARILHAGLTKGSSDLIAWRSMVITPDMIGRKIAVFASIEVKAAKGRLSAEQKTWNENVEAAGGIAIVARDPEDIQGGLDRWTSKLL